MKEICSGKNVEDKAVDSQRLEAILYMPRGWKPQYRELEQMLRRRFTELQVEGGPIY